MNKVVKLGFVLMVFGICLVSCADSKKGNDAKDLEVSKDQIENDKDAEIKDHGYEIAMGSYQCPMKCEGEKSYKKEGACPVCKMDLKKVEPKPGKADTSTSEAKEESSE